MTTIAAEVMLRCVYDRSKSMTDTDIERRPYHWNCSCSLHKSKGSFPTTCFQHGQISFPNQKSWTDCSLSVTVSRESSQSANVCDSSSMNKKNQTRHYQIGVWQYVVEVKNQKAYSQMGTTL
ncbi:hypothetical protein LguiB_024438 [Lonicera macranthoides]